MRALLIAMLALSFALAVAGCPTPPHVVVDAGPEPGSDAGFTPGGVDPTTYCESIVDFFCPFYLRCGRMAVADVDACRPVFLEACNARFEPTFVSLANAGLLELSQDGIDACKAHLDSVQCDQQVQDLDGPCSTMWVGKQAAGKPCAFDNESFTCAPGTACVLDPTFCGTCERVVDDGASCTETSVTCATTSSCDQQTFQCLARKKPGESCDAANRCVLGAICDNAVCVAPSYVGVGDACDFSHRCPFASQCIQGTCTASVELGASCSASVPCDSGFCSAGQDGTCEPLVAQGAPCSNSAQCQTGVCDSTACKVVPSACFP